MDPQLEEVGLFSMVNWDFNTFGLQQQSSILKSELFQGPPVPYSQILTANKI
jgi:hypothetical protein